RHRLFAEDNFSSFRCGQSNGRVQCVWDGDVDNVNVWAADDGFPFQRSFFPVPLPRESCELGRITATNDFRVQEEWCVEEMAHLMKGVRVGARDKSIADHCDIQCLVVLGHLIEPLAFSAALDRIAYCRRGPIGAKFCKPPTTTS